MTTISDIAKIAGVSKTTVSRVFNSKKYVSDEVRERVKAVADELKYIPNGNAISLSTGKTNTLGILLPANDYCYDELVNSILLNAKEKNYRVMVLPTYYESMAEETYYEMFRRKVVDGLILASINTPEEITIKLQEYGKIVSAEKLKSTEVPMIYPNRQKGYRMVFAELKARGVQSVMFTLERSPEISNSSKNKVNAYQEYFSVPIENETYFFGIRGFEEGYLWAKKTFETKEVPEVIYTSGDQVAAGVIKALNEREVYLGRDYQIVGEGNTPYSQAMNFSSLNFRLNEIGKELVEFMLSDKKSVKQTYEPKIFFRGKLKAQPKRESFHSYRNEEELRETKQIKIGNL